MNLAPDDLISQFFSTHQRLVVVSHIRPDGDAIGSLLGLGLALKNAGKEIQLILSDGVPASFRHLPGYETITRRIKGEYDASIVLDCSDLFRTGGGLGDRKPDLNIDHHITNLEFAELNVVHPEAEATCAILAEKLEVWGLSISQPVARALLTGVVSDTIGFRTSNVTAHTLRLAAKLMDRGANLAELYNRALVRRSFEAILYWGRCLIKLQRENRITWGTLNLQDREASGYTGNDDADLINVLSAIDETDIAVIFVEQRENKVKVSWRAQPGLDVSKIALSFGGGGHPAASGAEIPGSLPDVQARVLQATQTYLASQKSQNGNGNGNFSSNNLNSLQQK
jgi:phosphoesterase RecJ-like protein